MNHQREVLTDSHWFVLRLGFFSIPLPWLVPTTTRSYLYRLSHAQELARAFSIYGRCDVEVMDMSSNECVWKVPAPVGVPTVGTQFWAWVQVKAFIVENAS